MVKFMLQAIFWVSLSAAAGCNSSSGEGEEAPIIGDDKAAICSLLEVNKVSSGVVTDAVGVLYPSSADIRCADVKAFDEVAAYFFAVDYGAGHDCPSGCLVSRACGIYDAGTDEYLLYSAAWFEGDEVPPLMPTECPDLATSAPGNTSDCETSGKSHELVSMDAFNSFREQELQAEGYFATCFK